MDTQSSVQDGHQESSNADVILNATAIHFGCSEAAAPLHLNGLLAPIQDLGEEKYFANFMIPVSMETLCNTLQLVHTNNYNFSVQKTPETSPLSFREIVYNTYNPQRLPDNGKEAASQIISMLTGIVGVLTNPCKTSEDSHNEWMKFKADDGWTYGEVKDGSTKQHPCMVPYSELSPENKYKDYAFRNLILISFGYKHF